MKALFTNEKHPYFKKGEIYQVVDEDEEFYTLVYVSAIRIKVFKNECKIIDESE